MRPRLGFLGVGWIGRNRMEAVLASGAGEAVAVADPSDAMADAALQSAPGAERVAGLDDMLALDVDGVVIATPSALHAAQAIPALRAGAAVFCQKPLGRDGAETARVIAVAREAGRLLGLDLSYRFTAAGCAVRELVRGGALGRVYAADLVFHNAYGPDKDWFYDSALSGGGCVADLGVHLVDFALWALDWPDVETVSAHLFAGGAPLRDFSRVEDFAVATLGLAGGAVVRIACSWRLPAGQDAVIEASFYGAEGGAAFRNVAGSFYDFEALHFRGTARERLVRPPDAWGGRAAVAWAQALARDRSYDPEIENTLRVAGVLDRIYGRA